MTRPGLARSVFPVRKAVFSELLKLTDAGGRDIRKPLEPRASQAVEIPPFEYFDTHSEGTFALRTLGPRP